MFGFYMSLFNICDQKIKVIVNDKNNATLNVWRYFIPIFF